MTSVNQTAVLWRILTYFLHVLLLLIIRIAVGVKGDIVLRKSVQSGIEDGNVGSYLPILALYLFCSLTIEAWYRRP